MTARANEQDYFGEQTTSQTTVRIELRAKNAALHRLVTADGHTVTSFCRAHGLYQGRVGGYIQLKVSPYLIYPAGAVSLLADRLCRIARMAPDDLFPTALYASLCDGPVVGEVSVEQFVALSEARVQSIEATQETQLGLAELRETLESALAKLWPRERDVIQARFGLLDGVDQSLREIGDAHGVTPERIRQIAEKALRKLRHPSRSRPLRSFLSP